MDVLLAYEAENDSGRVSFDEVRNILQRELPCKHFTLIDFFLQMNKDILEDKHYDKKLILSRILGFNDDEKLVRLIIGTYDLSPKLTEKLNLRVSKSIKEFYIDGFDNVYCYIAELIERYRLNYVEKNYIRLDHQVNGNDEINFYELIGVEEESLTDIEEYTEPKMSLVEVVDVIKNKIDKLDLLLVQQLLQKVNGKNDVLLNLSPEDVLDNAEQIQERIRALAYKYELDGKLIMPKRPIIEIHFPSGIRFGRRNYNGNPLEFFSEHKEIYGGMGRYELQRFDSGLYDSLRTKGQLDLAIPIKKRKKLTTEQVSELVRILIANHGDAVKTAKTLEISTMTARFYGKKNKVEIRDMRGQPLSHEEKNRIIEEHKTYAGNATQAAKQLNHGTQTILDVWRSEGLETRTAKLPDSQAFQIIQAYVKYRGNINQASRNLGCSWPTIKRYWKKAGLIKM